MASWFEIIFKYPAVFYEQGSLSIRPFLPAWTLVLLFLLLCGIVWARVLSSPVYHTPGERLTSGSLRTIVLLLLCIPLVQPVLVVPDVVAEENFVAVVVDGSRSMEIADGLDGATRGSEALELAIRSDESLNARLSPHFKLRYYTFGSEARRVDTLDGVFSQDATNISTAIQRVAKDFAGLPLAGIVLLSDGADNSSGDPMEAAMELRSRELPLYAVGFGQDRLGGDREILDISVNDGVEETTGTEIALKVRSQEEEAGDVRFNLLKSGEVVYTTTERLAGNGNVDQFSFFFEPEDTGAAEYLLRMEPSDSERNTQNNEIELLIDSRRDTLRVLYFEGQPRSEFKFIKRALEDDPAIRFISITRTGSDKLYRQGVSSASELVGGFPADQAEMNTFHAVLFGDIEASAFTPAQLRMIEVFVSRRGGGFLMGGGLNAFAEGDYWNTPIADLLPAEIDPARQQVLAQAGIAGDEDSWALSPTAQGYELPILKLVADPVQNRTRWSSMPKLNSINFLGPVKPGAVVLAERSDDSEPILLVHRYGKGRTAALATASTWRWQMLADADDTSHERFWRQMIRWLVASATERVDFEAPRSGTGPGDLLPLSVTVSDGDYLGVEDATVWAVIAEPDGEISRHQLQPDLAEPGKFDGTLMLAGEGIHELKVQATTPDGIPLGERSRSLLVRPSRAEYRNAGMRRETLERLAEATGGSYYNPGDAGELADRIRSRRTTRSVIEFRPLWDLPLIYLLALVLLVGEWSFRRKKGMP